MKKLTFILIGIIATFVGAQASLYRTYQTEDGLSHNSVWAVMQDSRGFMWFGTNDGLNRFDGLSFKVYRRSDNDTLSLGSNFIHCLYETSDGNILVGTKEGLYSYNPQRDNFSHISLDGKKFGNDKTSIHSIVPDEKGNVWIGCYGQGVYCLSPDMKVKAHYGDRKLPSRFVTAMAIDAAGNVWVGTDNAGLFSIAPSTGAVSRSSLNKVNVQSIHKQNNNTLWVGTSSDGLYHYDPRSDMSSVISLPNSSAPVRDIKAITGINPNGIIMGSEVGLLKMNYADGSLQFFDDKNSFDNLPDKSIFAITLDSEGGLWLGTYYYGVSYRSPRINAFSFYRVPLTGSNSGVNNILRNFAAAPDGNVLLSSRNDALSIFNPGAKSLNSVNLAGMFQDPQLLTVIGNEIWVSNHDSGLTVYSYPAGAQLRRYTMADGLPSNNVQYIYRTSGGKIIAGTNRGAAELDGERFTALPQLKNASVMTVTEDFSGNIWFATHFHGLFKKTKEGKFYNYKNRPGDVATIPGNNINNIFLDSKGKLWVGTEGEGLAIFNTATGKVEKRFSESSGLPSNIIYATLEDSNGNMWITTGGGLIKIEEGGNYIQNFRYLENLLKIHYTHNSALNAGSDGNLYFGGSGGFISFDPDDITRNEVAPAVLISDYTIDGRRPEDSAAAPEEIEMKSSDSTLGLDVACLSYLSPEQNVIAYRLSGYEDDWKYLTGSERHIEYMNLPWGNYDLELKGANSDGVWSEPMAIRVKVNRPLLMSNGMIVVYILLLILAGYVMKIRFNSIQRRRMVKFSHAKEKELYEAKIGFFTNIAHEIRTPLSLISAPLESILSSGDGNDKTRHNLVVMKSNVQRLLELINQLLDFRKVEAQLMRLNFRKCNVSSIIEDICHRYQDFAQLHLIKLDFKGVEPDVECTIDPDAFEKIVGNLMSNAMKYADKSIKVTLKKDTEKSRIHLEVTDDGPGIKEKDMEKIFESFYRVDDHGKHPGSGLGLPLARSLAEMHEGTLVVESVYGHGSKFILDIPTTLEEGEATITEDEEGNLTIEEGNPADIKEEKDSKSIVLIVEDNEQLREFIAENLEGTYAVKTASNGIEAIKELEHNMIDIIVSDIMMPDMDGIELCRVVRSTPEFSHIPIVILSAKTDVETKVEGLNIGADAYIEKPFSMEQLKAQINSIFESRRRLRESLIQSPLDYYKTHFSEDSKEAENAEFIKKLNDLILDNLTNPDFSIDSLAQEFFMSRSSFHKRIKGITGETPNDYIRIIRLSKSAELLASGKYQIVEVCYMVGFNTPSYFSKCFAKHFGKLPKEYINDLNNNNK